MKQLLFSLVILETPNDIETAVAGILLPTEQSKSSVSHWTALITMKSDWKYDKRNPEKLQRIQL